MAKQSKEEKEDKVLQIKIGIYLVSMLVVISLIFSGYQYLFADNILVDKPAKVLYIQPGAGFNEVHDSLIKGGFLHDELSFMFLSRLSGYRDKVLPGRYEFASNTDNFTLFKTLMKGRQTPLKLTFNNVRTRYDLAGKFGKKMAFDSLDFLAAINNLEVCGKYGFNDTTIMTMFIPNTYEAIWTWKPEELLEVLHKEYVHFWTDERIQKARDMGLTPIQASILASIVEEETLYDQEAPAIAGVYHNRLKAGQRLQADPTLVFASGDFTIKRVTAEHRWIESPYNTYRRKGLPPGPIDIPSIASLEAVLNPEKHDFYFFCARPDMSGYHNFTHDFNAHVNLANSYRKALDKAGIH